MKSWLENNNVVITGASSGIGKDLAKILIEKYSCNVLGVARSEDKLKEFKESLKDFSSKFDYVVADVSQFESWQSIFENVVAALFEAE